MSTPTPARPTTGAEPSAESLERHAARLEADATTCEADAAWLEGAVLRWTEPAHVSVYRSMARQKRRQAARFRTLAAECRQQSAAL